MLALFISGALTLAFSIAILFGIGDIRDALTGPTKYPIIHIFHVATRSRGATTAMVCALISALLFSTFGLLACASRLAWAFARDHGFPFSNYFAHVSVPLSFTAASRKHKISMSLTLLPGQQTLHDPRPGHHPHHPYRQSPRARQHWLLDCLQRLDFPLLDRSLYLLSPPHHSTRHPTVWEERNTLGPMDVGKMGLTDQFSFHGLLHRADCIHGLSSVPTRARGEYELRKRDIWSGYGYEYCSVVRLWEESLLGTCEGGA